MRLENTSWTEDPITLDPLVDTRWHVLVGRHPRASIFHSVAWLNVLQKTYGYEPVVFGYPDPESGLRSGIVFCKVRSWLTGKRLVCLPFSDHCDPLVDRENEFQQLLAIAANQIRDRTCKYVELRPLNLEFSAGMFQPYQRYLFHRLNLRPSLESLYKNLHVNSIRRKIQKAEREGLSVESGNSKELLLEFYALHVLTRRRQSVPPHPLKWFRNILDCLGSAAILRIARRNRTPVAAVLTLEKGTSLVYKYGCSDAQFHSLGAMPFVFWNMISDAKSRGMLELDMGRSEPDNAGLIAFKEKWGAIRHEFEYSRYPLDQRSIEREGSQTLLAKRFFSRCPNWLLITAGNLLYPHVG